MKEVVSGSNSLDFVRTNLALQQNHSKYTEAMLCLVQSGDLERQFGQKYSEEALLELFNQMELNVKEILPGSGYVDPIRKEKLLKPNNIILENISGGGRRTEKAPSQKPNLRQIVRSYLQKTSRVPFYINFVGFPKIKFETNIAPNAKGNFFGVYDEKPVNNSRQIKAEVHIKNPSLPVAQEEYFHAAQELTFGTVESSSYALDRNIADASKHVTHASLILDRVLSAAATSLGPEEFRYWSEKADSVNELFRSKFLTNRYAFWEKTPLGKEVNKRFRYPICNYREVGGRLSILAHHLENFLFDKHGHPNDNNSALFEIVSIQFGKLQSALSFQMIDIVDTRIKNDEDCEKVGRELIEWGKKVLKYYKNRPEAEELVTHHTHISEKLDVNSYQYESTRKIVELLNASNGLIPTININLGELSIVSSKLFSERVDTLLKACFPHNPDEFVEPSEEILKKSGFNKQILIHFVEKAKLYQTQNRTDFIFGVTQADMDRIISYFNKT